MASIVKCDNCGSRYADVLGQDFIVEGKLYHFCMDCLVLERHRRKADMILNAIASGVTESEVTNEGMRVIEKQAELAIDAANKPQHQFIGGSGSYAVYCCKTSWKQCDNAGQRESDGVDLWRCSDCGEIIEGAP
jgi:hypothetical protein